MYLCVCFHVCCYLFVFIICVIIVIKPYMLDIVYSYTQLLCVKALMQ